MELFSIKIRCTFQLVSTPQYEAVLEIGYHDAGLFCAFISNQLLTRFFNIFAYDSCVLGILFVNPIMLAMVVLNFEHSAPCQHAGPNYSSLVF